jgi:hypothetical protein
MGHKTRIMYIECKAGGLTGAARIGRVTYSKTGAPIYYRGKEFSSLKGAEFKANYDEVETDEEYWIPGHEEMASTHSMRLTSRQKSMTTSKMSIGAG